MLAAAAMGCLPLAGCGYTTKRPFRQNIRSVYVPIFASKEFRRGLEFQLTEALQKRIIGETPYALAERPDADTELTGEVVEVRQASLGTDFRTDLPRETVATLVVRFRWKDLRTGKILVERDRFVQQVDYIRPVGEDFYLASQKGMDRLAERIVEQMEDAW